MRLRVPEGYSTVASGLLDEGYPKTLPPQGRMTWTEYRFSATQPVRYLGWATSRFVHVDSAPFSIPFDGRRRRAVDGGVVHVR